jgi:alkylation response protein AidB-like acyl-CoA dehydrogenase
MSRPDAGSALSSSYLNPEQLAMRDLVREFAMREVLPVANELDPLGEDMPMSLRKQMADMGLFGILIPEEYGGMGLGVFEYAIVTEELSRAWMSVASIIARSQAFTEGFNEEQRREFLPRAAQGDFLGAFALSEADAGSDAANLSCRARREGDEWVVTGQKMWCTFADGADYLLLFARTQSDVDPAHKSRGISCFLIPKSRGELPPGVQGAPLRKIGYRGWRTWELSFDNFRIPANSLLGEEGRGFALAMSNLDLARVHTAARSIGLARAALEDSVAYLHQRVQFGRPLGDNQALRFKVAEMATQIEAARALMYQVCKDMDEGRPDSQRASMVKLFASEMSERVTSEGLQIHGGAGYTTDFAVERHWRDARLTKIFEGASEIQLRIISDRILGRAR